MWEVATGRRLLQLRHRGIVIGLGVSPDGQRVVTANWDGTARVSDAVTGEALVTFRRHRTQCPADPVACWVSDAEFSPDGRRVASVDVLTGHVRIWAAADGREIRLLRSRGNAYSYAVEWSSDGRRVAATSGIALRVWDVSTGRTVFARQHAGEPLANLAFSADGTRLASLGSRNDMRIWDAERGRQLLRVTTGSAGGLGLRWSPDSERVAVGLFDGTVKLFDAATGDEVLALRGPSYDLAFSPDGTLLAGTRPRPEPALKVFVLDVERLLEIARDRVTRSLTDEECHQYLQGPCPSR
jgi:WD40 repeat protein